MIKYVIFDLGQVLVKVDPQSFLVRFAKEFKLSLLDITQNQADGAHEDFMVGQITEQEFHRKTCEHVNHFIPIGELKDIWVSMLVGEIEGTADIVNELHEKKYHLALLSNTDPWHFEYCQSILPVLQKFERTFLSYALKQKKPDPGIFLTVANELKVTPAQCLLIDDAMENIISAKNVNYQVIHFKNAARLRQDLLDLDLIQQSCI